MNDIQDTLTYGNTYMVGNVRLKFINLQDVYGLPYPSNKLFFIDQNNNPIPLFKGERFDLVICKVNGCKLTNWDIDRSSCYVSTLETNPIVWESKDSKQATEEIVRFPYLNFIKFYDHNSKDYVIRVPHNLKKIKSYVYEQFLKL